MRLCGQDVGRPLRQAVCGGTRRRVWVTTRIICLIAGLAGTLNSSCSRKTRQAMAVVAIQSPMPQRPTQASRSFVTVHAVIYRLLANATSESLQGRTFPTDASGDGKNVPSKSRRSAVQVAA